MNFLLVMPRVVNRIGEGYNFPLGIPYVSGAMKAAGLNVYCLNLNHYYGSVDSVLGEWIEKNSIDAVFVGGTSGQFYPVKKVVDATKKISNKIFVLVGGGLITSDPIPAMEALENADVGVIGEGEVTDTEIAKALENKKDFRNIDGIIYKINGKYTITKPREEIKDLDSIPWPDYDGFEFEKTLDSNPAVAGVNSQRTIAMLMSRSCPFSCSFCFHTVGNKYRQRSLNGFFEEFDYYYNKYKIEYLFIEDELFSYNSARVEEFCERIKKYNIKWWAQMRVDNVDIDLVRLMKEAGCDNLSLGLESADDTVLSAMGKHTTVAQIEKSLALIRGEEIASEGSFIFGDESESYETATNTLNWWKSHLDYRISLGTITVFPGSRLYKNALAKGIIKDPVQYLKDGCPQINITKMSDEEFVDIVEQVMKLPMRDTAVFDSISVLEFDSDQSRVTIEGTCSNCGMRKTYRDIKLFIHAPVSCPSCGKKHSFLVPDEFNDRINANIHSVCNTYGKVAFWGVNYQTYSFIEQIEATGLDDVIFVDSSTIKQKMVIHGKRIHSPHIINEQDIRTVIITIPTHYAEIEMQINYQYPNVSHIFDIGMLVNDNMKTIC